ncbi:Gfo/Idh/MocA family protein [Leucothrix arctica]|uniref:Oxidoreductase n=1 Tax=Leucothrix arctica TaxID=1481894 RepID=A0A317C956_9GAMM|nr:Gfo/Idh/MocA family oxidoreductase [Leucothrix arctica]PWQ95225.1 oxidoreductase [Leucothrix arctica]
MNVSSNTVPLRLGMVGGGEGAFIGGVHRFAARLDGHFDLVAGALSSDTQRSLSSGLALGLAADRCYASFSEMAVAEAKRDDGIQVVAIVTPNHLHFAAAKAFLEQGIHVICDKPLTSNLEDAYALAKVARNSDSLFVLSHNYTAYPMVRQAREMVQKGDLGSIRLVQVEYAQDWLTEKVEASGAKQAVWRTDPKQSGKGGAIGDIGTHAFNLANFISGMVPKDLLADLDSFVEGRLVDDNAHILMRYAEGAKGMIWASQVAPGHENDLKIRIYGDKGGLEWQQTDPNKLWHSPLNENRQLITRGGHGQGDAAARVTRTPAGHPEGYLEAFATIYVEAAQAIRSKEAGESVDDLLCPTVGDGLLGMRFIVACIESSGQGAVWTKI